MEFIPHNGFNSVIKINKYLFVYNSLVWDFDFTAIFHDISAEELISYIIRQRGIQEVCNTRALRGLNLLQFLLSH